MNLLNNSKLLIKIGGSVLHNEITLDVLSGLLTFLQNSGSQIIIVHGGGKHINEQLKQLNITNHFVDGIRVTSPQTMDHIKEVLCQKVNPMLVDRLQEISTVGLNDFDHALFTCEQLEKYGSVGHITNVNSKLIESHLKKNKVPVIAPVGMNKFGKPLNINADVVAAKIACAMNIQSMVYLTDTDGILDKYNCPIPILDVHELYQISESHSVNGGMLIKAKCIIEALTCTASEVHIINGNKPNHVIQTLLQMSNPGTLCLNHKKQEAVA